MFPDQNVKDVSILSHLLPRGRPYEPGSQIHFQRFLRGGNIMKRAFSVACGYGD